MLMAAAAILAAYNDSGTKAYYVLDRNRKNPGLRQLCRWNYQSLSINTGKMNKTQQEVLRLISEGTFERRDIEAKWTVSFDDELKHKGKKMIRKIREHDFCTCGHLEEKTPKKINTSNKGNKRM